MILILLLGLLHVQADLLSMIWSHGDLKPSFETSATTYSVILPRSVDEVTFTGVTSNDRYFIYVSLVGGNSYNQSLFDHEESQPFNLTFGDNNFFITDEVSEDVYTVIITRVNDIPEPEPDPTVQPCDDDLYNLLVGLIAAQYENEFECATLSTRVHELTENGVGAPISTDEMCACYVLSPTDLTYTYDCSLLSTQLYSIADMARMCLGDIGPSHEGITNIVLINQIGYDFDESDWEGNLAGTNDPDMSRWWSMRQTYNITDDAGTGSYLYAQFTTDMKGNWTDYDAVIFGVNYKKSFTYYSDDLDNGDCPNPCQTTVLIPLEAINDPFYTDLYTIIIDSTLNGNPDDESFIFSMDTLGIISDEQAARICMNEDSNKENTVYPMFIHEDSRFYLSPDEVSVEDKARLKLSITVPRALFDFEISFQDATNDRAGYDESRVYDYDADETHETYWQPNINGETDACYSESWTAYIPWEVFGPTGGAGGAHIRLNATNGTHFFGDERYYLFGSELIFEGKEFIRQVTDGGRVWEEVKTLLWRMPFLVRFQRLVYTDTTLVVNPHPYQIKFVVAITKKVQSGSIYTLDSRQDYFAKFDLELRSRIQFPFIFVTGEAADDPPLNWLNLNRDPEVYPNPLDDSNYYPAQVRFSSATANVDVEAYVTFISQVDADCTYIDYTDFTENYERVCEQYWNLEIYPSSTSCFASGTYEITWSVRCFYDRPACYFLEDEDGVVQNSVSVTLDIETTRFCPVVIDYVGAEGRICSTGKDRYYMCDDYVQNYAALERSQNPVLDTYFQGDDVHFFLEVDSEEARIIYSRIYQIWVKQDMAPLSGTSVLHDISMEEFKVYDYSDPVGNHTFTAEGTSETLQIENVILGTQNSNYFATYGESGFTDYGTDPTDEGLFSGFVVRLDPRIFPVLTDSQSDVEFMVVLDIFFEGWGKQKTPEWDDSIKPVNGIGRRRRVLSTKTNGKRSRKEEVEEGRQVPSGSDQIMTNTDISISPPTADLIPCFKDGVDYWAIEMLLNDLQFERWSNQVTKPAFEDEFKTSLEYIIGARTSQLSLELMSSNDPLLRSRGSNIVAVLKVQGDKHKSHSPADLYDHLSLLIKSNLIYAKQSIFEDMFIRRVTCLDVEEDNSTLDLNDLLSCVFGEKCDLLGQQDIIQYLTENLPEEESKKLSWLIDPNQLVGITEQEKTSGSHVFSILIIFLSFCLLL